MITVEVTDYFVLELIKLSGLLKINGTFNGLYTDVTVNLYNYIVKISVPSIFVTSDDFISNIC